MSANPAQPFTEVDGPRAAENIERRQSNRQTLGAVGVMSSEGEARFGSQLQVLVMNVSLGGVGFTSPVEFRPGKIYMMRIGTGPLHLKARVQIVSSRQREDGTWDVGGKFI